MERPETFADWATDSDNIVAPPASMISAGWQRNDRPASSFFNWWKNLTGRWIRHIDEKLTHTDETITHMQQGALKARYTVDNHLLSDLEPISGRRYWMPVGDSCFNISSVKVSVYSPYLFSFSVRFSGDVGQNENLAFISQADGIGMTPFLTSQQLDRRANPEDDELDLNVRVIQYNPEGDWLEESAALPTFVPGLFVVAF